MSMTDFCSHSENTSVLRNQERQNLLIKVWSSGASLSGLFAHGKSFFSLAKIDTISSSLLTGLCNTVRDEISI